MVHCSSITGDTCDYAGQLVAQAGVGIRHERDHVLSRKVAASGALLVPNFVRRNRFFQCLSI